MTYNEDLQEFFKRLVGCLLFLSIRKLLAAVKLRLIAQRSCQINRTGQECAAWVLIAGSCYSIDVLFRSLVQVLKATETVGNQPKES